MSVADFPQKPEIDVSRIPFELKKIPRWLVWRYEPKKSETGLKYIKPPYQASGHKADVTKPEHWSTWAEVESALLTAKWHGVGLALDGSDGLVAWDLDRVIDPKDGSLVGWAERLVEELDSYTEVTPSGEGLRIICRGTIPKQGKKVSMSGNSILECYTNARYVTITGMVYGMRDKIEMRDTTPIWKKYMDGSVDVKKVLKQARLEKLVAGDLSDFDGDHSAADLAFCQAVADKLKRDPKKIDEAVRQTGLFRPKWDEVHGSDGRTYGQMTIDKAIEILSSRSYTPKFPLTDSGNAMRFVALHGHEVRHCQDGWYVWDGARLERDELGRAELMTKDVAADIAAEVESAGGDEDAIKAIMKAARDAESRRIRDNVLALASVEIPISVDFDFLDSRAELFCCGNGVIKNGSELLPHSFDYLITRRAMAKFNPDAKGEMWLRFLNEIFPDAEIREYVQRLVGYSMTGEVSEQEFYFCYGSGANGKSAFFEAIKIVFGDYFTDLPTNALMEQRYEQHPTALMALRGSRLALASEVSEGRRLNEELIKAATGESRITARRMRQDFVTFRNSAKLWVMGNHRPAIRGSDDAIWRRVKVIPFTAVIPEGQRVKHLGKIIGQGEAEGVLAWAAEGWRAWLRDGMRTPEKVKVAIAEYREEMDQVRAFVEDECIVGEGEEIDMQSIHAKYTRWAEASREHVLSVKALSQRLQEKGYVPFRNKQGRRAWRGLSLREPLSTQDIPF